MDHPQRSWLLAVVMLATLITMSCSDVLAPWSRAEEEKPGLSCPLAPWEEKVGDLYATRGVAKVEKVGTRYVLTTYCAGAHSVYAEGGEGVTLDSYLGVVARFHYSYITRVNTKIRCVRAPCEPTTEKIAVVKNVEPISATERKRLWSQPDCANDAPR